MVYGLYEIQKAPLNTSRVNDFRVHRWLCVNDCSFGCEHCSSGVIVVARRTPRPTTDALETQFAFADIMDFSVKKLASDAGVFFSRAVQVSTPVPLAVVSRLAKQLDRKSVSEMKLTATTNIRM